jgi:hypothetical protein
LYSSVSWRTICLLAARDASTRLWPYASIDYFHIDGQDAQDRMNPF